MEEAKAEKKKPRRLAQRVSHCQRVAHRQTCTDETKRAILSPEAAEPHEAVLAANSSDFTLTLNAQRLQLTCFLLDDK